MSPRWKDDTDTTYAASSRDVFNTGKMQSINKNHNRSLSMESADTNFLSVGDPRHNYSQQSLTSNFSFNSNSNFYLDPML